MVFAGDVDAVGPGVAAAQVGQAVYGFDRFRFGCYAEYGAAAASSPRAARTSPSTRVGR